MKIIVAHAISVLSMLSTPVAAANFYCPTPQSLPETLNLQPAPAPQPQLKLIQNYLNNLKAITHKYQTSNGFPKRRQVLADCLRLQVESLYITNALQRPVTRADGATWFLVHNEVVNAMNLINPRETRRRSPSVTINAWLNSRPRYAPGSPYALPTAEKLASR